jgi:hypothetical protein
VDVPVSTLEGITADRKALLAAWGRRLFLLLVFLLVVAGLCGFLGVRDATASASGGGYGLSLHYPRIARAGLDVPWEATVTHEGGFSGPIVLEVTGDYFEIFESQGVSPEPSKETQDGTWWRLTFDPPAGDTFVLTFDIYVQPASQIGRGGTLRVLDGGVPAASLDFHTFLLP